MTTYAENLIMLSVTKIYSPIVILFAALVAIILGFISKFGAIVNSIPPVRKIILFFIIIIFLRMIFVIYHTKLGYYF